MQHLVKSTVWYLKNLETQNKHYLNVGDFTIGRCSRQTAALNVDVAVKSKFISKIHCTFEYRMDIDSVWLHNNVSYVCNDFKYSVFC